MKKKKLLYPRKINQCLCNFLSVSIGFFSLKFGGISLMLCGLYLKESNTWERLNLARVRYMPIHTVENPEKWAKKWSDLLICVFGI